MTKRSYCLPHLQLTNTLLFCVCMCQFISALKIVVALGMESKIL